MTSPLKKAPDHLRFAAIAVDIILFGMKDGVLHTLLVPVHRPPYYLNTEGFIGGLIDARETAEEAVLRHLREKGFIDHTVYTEQLYTFSALERDPRNRVISAAYIGCVSPEVCERAPKGTEKWVPVSKIQKSKLPYDHGEMLERALARLDGKLAYTTIAQFMLPKSFTLTELQSVYEVVRKKPIDKRNFRKKILALGIVEETGKMQEGVKNRPAALYTFKKRTLIELDLF